MGGPPCPAQGPSSHLRPSGHPACPQAGAASCQVGGWSEAGARRRPRQLLLPCVPTANGLCQGLGIVESTPVSSRAGSGAAGNNQQGSLIMESMQPGTRLPHCDINLSQHSAVPVSTGRGVTWEHHLRLASQSCLRLRQWCQAACQPWHAPCQGPTCCGCGLPSCAPPRACRAP